MLRERQRVENVSLSPVKVCFGEANAVWTLRPPSALVLKRVFRDQIEAPPPRTSIPSTDLHLCCPHQDGIAIRPLFFLFKLIMSSPRTKRVQFHCFHSDSLSLCKFILNHHHHIHLMSYTYLCTCTLTWCGQVPSDYILIT